MPISKWVQICINIENGKAINTTAAICPQLSCGFILKLLFLKQIKAKQGFLQTNAGIFQLIKGMLVTGKTIGVIITELPERSQQASINNINEHKVLEDGKTIIVNNEN